MNPFISWGDYKASGDFLISHGYAVKNTRSHWLYQNWYRLTRFVLYGQIFPTRLPDELR